MFGYLTVAQPEMKIKDFTFYRSVYCGLCANLGSRCGVQTTILLNYDMAFLVLLLTSLYEEPWSRKKGRCIPHPVKEHEESQSKFTDYAADMLILLSYYKLQDDWDDEKRVDRLAFSKLIGKQKKRVSVQYPRQAEQIEKQIKSLTQMQKDGEQNLDRLADCTGQMMAEIFALYDDAWAATLRDMGQGLGKAIYLMDAYEDVDKDVPKNRFNPFARQYEQEGFDEFCQELINTCMAQCTLAFERLPILESADILRNVLYAGVWTRFNATKERRNAKNNGENANGSI